MSGNKIGASCLNSALNTWPRTSSEPFPTNTQHTELFARGDSVKSPVDKDEVEEHKRVHHEFTKIAQNSFRQRALRARVLKFREFQYWNFNEIPVRSRSLKFPFTTLLDGGAKVKKNTTFVVFKIVFWIETVERSHTFLSTASTPRIKSENNKSYEVLRANFFSGRFPSQ